MEEFWAQATDHNKDSGGRPLAGPTMLGMAYLDFALDIFHGFCSNFLKTGTPIEVTPLVVFYWGFFQGV